MRFRGLRLRLEKFLENLAGFIKPAEARKSFSKR